MTGRHYNIHIPQHIDSIEKFITRIGDGKMSAGFTKISEYMGMRRQAVEAWVHIHERIPQERFKALMALAEECGFYWHPKELMDERVKERKCLTCGVMFRSSHVGNRMCYRCVSSDSDHSADHSWRGYPDVD